MLKKDLTNRSSCDIINTERKKERYITMKRFNKEVITEKGKELVKKEIALKEELKNMKELRNNNFKIYFEMEGKYSTRTVESRCDTMGGRNFEYVYENEEIRKKEKEEREKFYKENIENITEQTQKIEKQLFTIQEEICFEQWGCSIKDYSTTKEIERTLQDIEILKEEIKEKEIYLQELKCKMKH